MTTRLQLIRLEKHITQKQLGELSGVPFRTIQEYETGAKNINGAKLQTLIKLATALHCKISDIVDDGDLVNDCKRRGI